MECTRAVRRAARTVRTAVLVTAAALLAGGLLATTPSAGPTTTPTALPNRIDAANRGW
jgi:hypothetical protein